MFSFSKYLFSSTGSDQPSNKSTMVSSGLPVGAFNDYGNTERGEPGSYIKLCNPTIEIWEYLSQGLIFPHLFRSNKFCGKFGGFSRKKRYSFIMDFVGILAVGVYPCQWQMWQFRVFPPQVSHASLELCQALTTFSYGGDANIYVGQIAKIARLLWILRVNSVFW